MVNQQGFSGAYPARDVTFLLTPTRIGVTDVAEKERLIQSGQKHYSDMLSAEPVPSEAHLRIYQNALAQHSDRLTMDVLRLANTLKRIRNGKPITLISLVRAGVPLGVMLQRALVLLGVVSTHYGISILRGRGIDSAALDTIESAHDPESIFFVDGWTGKGAITGELSAALHGRAGYPAKPRLVVLADPAGCAWLSASQDDWLIPFGIMGATVSGLISRSVYSDNGYHQCMVCDHLKDFECGVELVDLIEDKCREVVSTTPYLPWLKPNVDLASDASHQSKAVISALSHEFGVQNHNHIKPSIAEATRAVLRRVPEHVLVRDLSDPDVALLVHLANEQGVPVIAAGSRLGNYRAVTIIKKV